MSFAPVLSHSRHTATLALARFFVLAQEIAEHSQFACFACSPLPQFAFAVDISHPSSSYGRKKKKKKRTRHPSLFFSNVEETTDSGKRIRSRLSAGPGSWILPGKLLKRNGLFNETCGLRLHPSPLPWPSECETQWIWRLWLRATLDQTLTIIDLLLFFLHPVSRIRNSAVRHRTLAH